MKQVKKISKQKLYFNMKILPNGKNLISKKLHKNSAASPKI